MKDQYFGDIRDWFKYVVLRVLLRKGLTLTVGWMLTEDDSSGDGELRGYLQGQSANRRVDPELYQWLLRWQESGAPRQVQQIERSGLLEKVRFHRTLLTDNPAARDAWFAALHEVAAGADVVFLDPDNGLEVRSHPRGKRKSSKYVYWREVVELWNRGHSVVVYQHFARVTRRTFLRGRVEELFRFFPAERGVAVHTAGTMFLIVARPEHWERLARVIEAIGAIGDPRLHAEELGEETLERLTRPIDYEAALREDNLALPGASGEAINRNEQQVVRKTDLPGSQRDQKIYVMRCLRCAHEYGCNGIEIFQRKCPLCQGGPAALDVWVH